jgi:hypothetical protein
MKTPFMVRRRRTSLAAFTLVEMLISVGVVVVLILLLTQLVNTAALITKTQNKHMSADTQARVVLDRIAQDFSAMLKRSDVDYFLKIGLNNTRPQTGNDQIAFYSQVQGYYPATSFQSPVSLVSYRINSDSTSPNYNKLERMGKGLEWNGYSGYIPILFLDSTGGTPPTTTIANTWPAATSTTSTDPDYEAIAPNVFRFEYYYLIKDPQSSIGPGNRPFLWQLSKTPWNYDDRPTQTSLTNPTSIGLVDIESIVVSIAVIDSESRSLLTNAQLGNLASQMIDFNPSGQDRPGTMENAWRTTLNNNISSGSLPKAALSAIRIYSRYFDLNSN